MLILGLVGVLFCLAAEAFFSSSEIALVSFDRLRLKSLVMKGVKSAELVTRLLSKPEMLLGTTLIGTNLSTVLSSSLITYLVSESMGERSEWVAVLIAAPLILIFAEALPKTIGQMHAERLALKVARPLSMARWLLGPIVSVLARLSYLFTGVIYRAGQKRSPLLTREDLEYALQVAGRRGGLQALERQIIHRILEFKDTVIEDVMIPLSEVIALEIKSPVERSTDLILKNGVSRIPLYRDRLDNVVGILVASDLLPFVYDKTCTLEGLKRPALYVPGSKLLREMLQQFRLSGEHMGVVVDEYGGAIGIITVEDILEEVVGEIDDEYDPRKILFRKLADNLYQVDARIEISRLREMLGSTLPEGEYETLGGFLLDRMKRIPKTGEVFVFGDYTFRITQASARAIEQIQVALNPRKPQ